LENNAGDERKELRAAGACFGNALDPNEELIINN
jgi:hypothetical protein